MWQLSFFYIYLTLKSNNYHYNYYLHSGLSCLLHVHVYVCVCVCVFSCPMFKSLFSKFVRKLSHISAKIKHCICFLKHYTKQKTVFSEEITHCCFFSWFINHLPGFPRTNEWMPSTKKKKKKMLAKLPVRYSWHGQRLTIKNIPCKIKIWSTYFQLCLLPIYLQKNCKI